MKLENTSTHHRRNHNVSGTTLVSFLSKFKASSNNPGHKRHLPPTHPPTALQRYYALCDTLKTDKKIIQIIQITGLTISFYILYLTLNFNVFSPNLNGHSVFFTPLDGIFIKVDLASGVFLYLVSW